MNGKYHHSLMVILVVLCLLMSDRSGYNQIMASQTDDMILSALHNNGTENRTVHFITENHSGSETEISFCMESAKLPVHLFLFSICGFAVLTDLVSRKQFHCVPKEERFFAVFQPALYLCARFLRELFILLKKDGKNERLLYSLQTK